jgi:hypothetical protein
MVCKPAGFYDVTTDHGADVTRFGALGTDIVTKP